ncbi:MAG: ClpP family protease [Mycobacteriaceae bacterium]
MSEKNPDPTRTLDQEIYRDLFERRIIVLGDALEQDTSNRLCTSLLLLSSRDAKADIVLLINSPGGSVPGMLAIRDTMRGIPNDVATVNIGMAYSAGQFLLSAGTPGKRFILPHAKVLLHQGSGGIGGTAQDIEIQAADMRHTRDTVLTCIADDTGQDPDKVTQDSLRDRWFTAEEAKDYGFVDRIIDDLDPITGPEGLTARRSTLGLGSGFPNGQEA